MAKNKDKCIFYDKYFLDDLESYEVVNINGVANIKYLNTNTLTPITLSPDITSIIQQGFSSISQPKENVWYPIFVDKLNNRVKNKFLFRGSAANNLVLGIDQAITFNGTFKNWNVSGSSKMCTDWIINSQLPAYLTEYGLMCWVQKSSYKAKAISIDDIPIGASIRYSGSLSYRQQIGNTQKTIQINSNHYLVKIDKNILQIFNNQESLFQNNQFNFVSQDRVFNITQYLNTNFPKSPGETDVAYTNRINDIRKNSLIFYLNIQDAPGSTPLNIIDPDTIIYIPRGDVHCYYEDTETRSLLGLPSLTYVASTMYQEYREIFNLLTIDYKKEKISILNQAQYRLLQKIAKFLSAHPLVDRTTISILLSDQAKTIVNNFINSVFASVDMEIIALKIALKSLSELFIDLTAKAKNSNGISGYCFNYADLVKNLMSKYDTYLNIDTPTTINYKSQLRYGPHIKVNQNIISKTNINASNTILYNNFRANIGPYIIESVINQQQTYFSIKDSRSNSIDSRLNIPLWDIKKKRLLDSKLVVTAGSDFIIQYGNRPIGTEIVYSMEGRDLGEIEGQILENEKLQIVWSKISGPDCLRFSDSNLTTIRNEDGTASGAGDTNLRFEESTDARPNLYIKKPGRYILRLKIITLFGVFYDKVTVYVVNQNGEYEPGKRPRALLGANMIEIKPTNGLVVICPNLREFAFGKQGIFWPTYSDLNIYDEDSNPYGTVASFGGYLKKYKIPENTIANEPCNFSLSYIPNNTTIQISRIILSHMMDNNPDCYNCPTFFQNIVNNKGFTIDVSNTFTLENPETNALVEIDYPENVSTDSTRVITYGNHSAKTITDLGVTIPFHPPTGSALPAITGLEVSIQSREGSPTHLCHLKNVDSEKSIIFERGCFHPSSGWLVDPNSTNLNHARYRNSEYNSFLNKSSVINFTPERRKTFKFKGPGFFNLNNLSAERTNIREINNANVYFSTIVLGLEQKAQDTKINSLEAAIAQEKKEIDDHQRNLGYRNAEGSKASTQAVNTDEFRVDLKVEPDGAAPSSEYCVDGSFSQNYQVSYSFPRKGSYLPQQMRRPDSRFTLDISRAKIEDIEVQIEFMNYVNTKNLIIWLDVLPCSNITSSLFPKKASDIEGGSSASDRWSHVPENIENSVYSKSYRETKTKINQMEEGPLKKYLQALFEMNDNPPLQETVAKVNTSTTEGGETVSPPPSDPNLPKSTTYRIYLLNQEHVEGNKFNFGLKFTDNINKNTQPFDNNNIFEDVDPTLIKSVEKDGIIHLLPTLSAFGYSDSDVNFFRQIIQSNNLHTLNNRFKKFAGMPLFLDKDELAVGDTTQFSLGISVINQSDTMEIIDSVSSLDSKNAIDKTIDNIRPSLIDNNICCWYLILHINNNGTQRYLPTDILGNIDYDSYSPVIYGHNFIASFDDKKYLLPPINLNAPYLSTLDPDICKYAKESLNRPKFEQVPFNILPIILVGIPTNGAGAIVEAGNVDAQGDQLTKEIVDFFGSIRRSQQSEAFSRSLHVPKYDKYPFGGPDKILLSVSNDNILWYKLEASIFRYSNCPIVKKRRLGYLKLNYTTAKGLSIFKFSKLDDVKKLINPDDIKTVSIPLQTPNQISTITQESLQSEKKRLVDQADGLRRTIQNLRTPNEQLNKQLADLELKISLYDETIFSIGVKIRKYNLVEIKKTITKEETQSTPEEGYNLTINGLYLIQEDNTVLKILDAPGIFSTNKIINQLKKNSILDFQFVLISNPDPETRDSKPLILQNKLIIIDGLRAFYFFNKNDSIITIRPVSEYIEELRNSGNNEQADAIEKEIESLKQQLEIAKQQNNQQQIAVLEEAIWNKENLLNYNTVLAKGYIYDGKSHKTIIELAAPIIGNAITISPENSETILVYDKKYATVEDTTKRPYNKWTHAEDSNSIILKNKTQEQPIVSTFGEGMYGTGSLSVDPKILPYKAVENEVRSLPEQISIRNSFDKRLAITDIYYDNGAVYTTGTPIRIIGYNYTYEDNEFIKNNTPSLDLSTNKVSKFFNKNYSYLQNTDNLAFINIRSDFFKNTSVPATGEIVFDIDADFKLPSYKLLPSDISLINPRLALILQKGTLRPPTCTNVPDANKCFQAYWDGINPDSLYINDLYLYLVNVGYTNERTRSENEKKASLRLQNLITETSNILHYCDIGQATLTNPTGEIPIYTASPNQNMVLPINEIKVLAEQDGSLLFRENAYAQNDYWINIDPEQGCSFDFSAMPKILLETKYVCEQLNDFVSLEMQNICPVSMRNPQTKQAGIGDGIDENFIYEGNTFTYIPSARQLAVQFGKYSGVQWPPKTADGGYENKYLYFVNREFFINAFGKERNQLVKSTEKYLLPVLPELEKVAERTADGDLLNKVKDIFNLNNTTKLFVKVKRIPRKLRKYDPYYDRYIPNYLGELTKSLIPGPGGPVDSTLQFWHCIDYVTGQYTDLPRYFKWLNEMIYRAYYGSTDAVEHSGKNLSESRETFDWIPYDYV